jgi:hypothetical protein
MKKLSPQEIFEFEKKFNNHEFPHQRYGQAFCNHFNIEVEVFPGLFYQEDDRFARMNAWLVYMDDSESTNENS